MSRGKDDFLSRWSRRKRTAEPEEDAPAPDDAAPAAEIEGEPDAEADSLLLQELGLKEPEEVSPGDELAAFLRAAIPAHLKRRALRQLWGSNPVLANLDGLNDYDGDFTGNTVPRGELKTVYRVGKGMIRDLVEKEAEEPPAPEAEEPALAAIPDESAEEPPPDAEEVAEPAAAPLDQPEAPAKRRMAFRFDRDEG